MSKEETDKYKQEFYSNDINKFAQNIVSKTDPLEACLNRLAIDNSNHVFNHKVDEVKPVTNQRSSGRCWLFAVLNAMRVPFMKKMEMDEVEFSQSHLFFWDKIERSNYFLNSIVSVFKRSPDENPGSRLASFLLHDPCNDGGQWDMVANLIEKHGVMPKICFPDTGEYFRLWSAVDI